MSTWNFVMIKYHPKCPHRQKMAYNTSSMEALNQLFSDKGQKLSNEEVRRFIYGTYPDSDDMHKRPLTRLIQNLMDENPP